MIIGAYDKATLLEAYDNSFCCGVSSTDFIGAPNLKMGLACDRRSNCGRSFFFNSSSFMISSTQFFYVSKTNIVFQFVIFQTCIMRNGIKGKTSYHCDGILKVRINFSSWSEGVVMPPFLCFNIINDYCPMVWTGIFGSLFSKRVDGENN